MRFIPEEETYYYDSNYTPRFQNLHRDEEELTFTTILHKVYAKKPQINEHKTQTMQTLLILLGTKKNNTLHQHSEDEIHQKRQEVVK